MEPADRRAAQQLGLGLAVAVAVFCDLVGLLFLAIAGQNWAGASPNPDLAVLFLAACVPVAAAAPFGWGLAPSLTRARLRGKIAITLLMAASTVLLGDVLVSAGLSMASGLAGFPVLLLFGFVFGLFVFVFATLPAAVVWVCMFRLAWRSR